MVPGPFTHPGPVFTDGSRKKEQYVADVKDGSGICVSNALPTMAVDRDEQEHLVIRVHNISVSLNTGLPRRQRSFSGIHRVCVVHSRFRNGPKTKAVRARAHF